MKEENRVKVSRIKRSWFVALPCHCEEPNSECKRWAMISSRSLFARADHLKQESEWYETHRWTEPIPGAI
jgi:hypothetical protein